METADRPKLSTAGKQELERYAKYLHEEQDLSAATVRNYLSDLKGFALFCESSWSEGEELGEAFSPTAVTTPAASARRTV